MKDSTRRMMKQLKHQRKRIAGNYKSRRQILKAMRLVRQDFRGK